MTTPAITNTAAASVAGSRAADAPATTGSTATTTTAPATKSSDAFDLDSNVFMKLLVANLQNQDPMSPQDSSSYMQQMSSMAMVEKLNSVASNSTTSLAEQQATQAIGLIGKKVTYLDDDDKKQTGTVEKVTTAGGTPTLTIGGVDGITMSQVAEVAPQ